MKYVGQGLLLSQQEKDNLKAFLLTLSDHEFINNSDYSNPLIIKFTVAILSPAKTLDFDTPCIIKTCRPKLIDDSQILINELKKLNSDNLSKLMKISNKLGSLNYERCQIGLKILLLKIQNNQFFVFVEGFTKA